MGAEISLLAFPHSGTTVVALLFRTEGAPYLVRAPSERFEVPWRGSTQTRSARRSELLSILYPAASQPAIELLDVSVTYRTLVNMKASKISSLSFVWQARLETYVTPRSGERLVFPFHKLSAHASNADRSIGIDFTSCSAEPQSNTGALMTYATPHELIVAGPGRAILNLQGSQQYPLDLSAASVPLALYVTTRAAGAETVLNLVLPPRPAKIVANTSATWELDAV